MAPAVVLQAANGLPTLKLGGRYVHSPRDPIREAERLAASVPAESNTVVLLGFGLGYLAEALIARFAPYAGPDAEKTISIIALEADPAILELARNTRNLEALIANPCFEILLPGTEENLANLLRDTSRPPTILKNAALVQDRPQWYAEQEELIALVARRTRTNKATKAKFARRWIRNTVMNAELAWQLPGIRQLYQVFEGLPALLVAAGPSLDRYRELLPALKERCVLVCVDTALRACLDAGCTPDFVLAVDPQYWNARHLDHIDTTSCTIVSELALWPALWRLPWKNRYLFSSLFPLGSWLESRVDAKGALAAGGSVATSAWDLCRALGCRDIHVLGLDLAYPAGRTHMRGAIFEEKSLMGASRLHPAELDSFLLPRNAMASRVPARDGGTILCDARMKMYVSWFSRVCTGEAHCRTHSLGNEGAAIDGIDCMGAEKLLALPVIRREIDTRQEKRLKAVQSAMASTEQTRERTFNGAIDLLAKQLCRLQRACEEAAVLCEEALACDLPRGDEKSFNDKDTEEMFKSALFAHDRAEALSGQENMKEVVGFLFSSCEDIERVLEESPGDKMRYHLAWIGALWRELEASARWQYDLLRKKFKVPAGGVDI